MRQRAGREPQRFSPMQEDSQMKKLEGDETVLITGASSGIGMHLAHEFARHGHPLVLVAPNEAELHRVAADLQAQHSTQVRVFAGDLEQPQTPTALFDELLRDEVR